MKLAIAFLSCSHEHLLKFLLLHELFIFLRILIASVLTLRPLVFLLSQEENGLWQKLLFVLIYGA